MKIVLAGSPQISVGAFEEVIKNFDVVAIVTQPDKPQGRGLILKQTPVAELGTKYNIKVFKPNKIAEIKNELASLEYDLLLSFAFGQFIPESILNQGKFKPLNIHGSLLPKYRGAAPIHYAILNGDSEIGITLMEMIKAMDAGAMYFKASQQINEETTTGEAFNIVAKLAKENIVSWLKAIAAGKVTPEVQPTEFTLSPKIAKEFGELSSEETAYEIKRKVKGLNPFPGAFTFIDQKRIKVFNISDKQIPNAIAFQAKDKMIYFTEYQFEGKNIVKL